MKPCPFCAEEIQESAIRCKHCGSDLAAAAPPVDAARASPTRSERDRARHVIAAAVALMALIAASPVLARTVARAFRSSSCQPATWGEWHAAIRTHCLDAAYVCRHMTTPEMLADPELVDALGSSGSRVADVVGRMRDAYGCAPERAPAFHPQLPEPGLFAPPAFPPRQDAPRDI